MTRKFALIIGNTQYTDPGLAQLTAPGKDAEDFARVLRDQNICAFDEVRVVLNQPEHIVRRAIEVYFSERKPSDLVVFYFSGHGIRDELGALYLAVKNTVRSRLRSTAIKSDYIREIMDQSRSKRQVLILDCCNSGAFAQGTKGATGVSMGIATAFEGTGYGHVVLTASDSTQFAWEGDQVIGETENSLFTHFLVKGLEGEADQDGDGTITVDELYDYAYEQIVNRTPKQTPGKWSYKQQGEIVLRERIKTEDIRPSPLPPELRAAVENILPYVREGAVKQLGDLLKSKNIGLARSARITLEKIANEDDSRYVAAVAQKALEVAEQVGDESAKTAKVINESQAKVELEQLDKKKFEEDRILQKGANAIQIARDQELRQRQLQPLSVTTTSKAPEHKWKRSTAVWTVVFLIGITLLIYATISLLDTGSPNSSQPTPLLINTQQMILATSTFAYKTVSTDPPTAEPTIITVVPTTPPTSTPSFTLTAIVDQSSSQDPEQFINSYFDTIIYENNYELAWSLLSDAFKSNNNSSGFDDWKGTWAKVVQWRRPTWVIEYITPTKVIVSTSEMWFRASDWYPLYDREYCLVRDEIRNTWIIESKTACGR